MSTSLSFDVYIINLFTYYVNNLTNFFNNFLLFFIAIFSFFAYYIFMTMNISEYIDLCLVKKGKLSHAELARLTDQSPQVLFKKFKNSTFKLAELEKIAAALGARLEIKFIDNETGEPII